MTCGSDSFAASAASRRNRPRYSGSAASCCWQPLDRDRPVALHVERAVDLAHAAPADQRVEPVGAEALGHRGLAITGNADASRRTQRASARAMPTVSSSENSGIPTSTAACSHQCGRSRAEARALSATPVQ